MSIALHSAVPDFEAARTGGSPFRLSDLKGQRLVLYFYPKDATPGCTDEGLQFAEKSEKFKELNCVILGLSRDSLSSHEKFKAKYGFPFELISDPDETICTLFGVMKQKNMYGKQVRGIERSTFLIDENGVLAAEWRGVKVPGHADTVLDALKNLK
jgi:peroxiredoxin Q/BCP